MTKKEEMGAIQKVQTMCEQSLAPDTYKKWEEVRHWLEITREGLKKGKGVEKRKQKMEKEA